VDCSSVHTIAPGRNSFPTSAVPSLHHRSKCAHHHPNTMQCLPSVHCHRINTITHLSPLCFPGRKVHIHLLVASRYPKYNLGFPLPQLRQVSTCQPRNFRMIYSHSLSARLVSFSQPIARKGISSCCVVYFPFHWIASKFALKNPTDVLCPLYIWCGMLPSIGILGLHSLPHSLNGFRAVPHPNSVSFCRLSCHAALPSLSLLLATVLTDSVIYICCDATGCFLLTCCIVLLYFLAESYHYIVMGCFPAEI
jgi:hypothetical protein